MVRAWELGQSRPSWFRALILLAPIYPALTLAELAQWSIGQRNSRLAALREATFGADLTAICPCPNPDCRVMAEFSATVRDLAPDLERTTASAANFWITVGETDLTCRVPTSTDLAHLSKADDMTVQALDDDALVKRCVSTSSPADLSAPDIVAAVVEAWRDRDPGVEAPVELSCEACGEVWTFSFDWVRFLWIEVAAAARDLLENVHLLAQAYGWSEAEILGLGTARREYYLDRIRA